MNKAPSLESNRSLIITYNLPISKTSKFWDELKQGKVYATKCKKCGKLVFPPVADCGPCGSSEIEWTELIGNGKIVTFTEVVVKPASFSEEPSYIVAIAKLSEGVKVLAWLSGIKKEKLHIGMKVKLKAKVFSDKKVAYEFVPA
ncbi:MAG: Zn-ribbon domain-containing OB-fold protein [Candidatus Bathyarchaeota archaeon]|nr:Zn-ribbon domain-containing OB-fold protein [Candidatus Bathyarchaeum tardum]WGM90438.1 MAG: Zn-ribbon domain-containing OB-fold protein [Candidatus Bathyarchaeum tardum]WNZ29492.1 MAG: Zn-ribbon domain-containing OB-fold protein [Candidatus Bathyarchaeota archaeon]